jgi:hypothetical protein
VWNRKGQLVEEYYLEFLERSRDSRKKGFQVNANNFESKRAKAGISVEANHVGWISDGCLATSKIGE